MPLEATSWSVETCIHGHGQGTGICCLLERLLNSQPSTGCDSLHPSLLSSLSADNLKAVSISEECVVDTLNMANLTVLHLCQTSYPCSTSHLLITSFFFFTAILRHGYTPKPITDCTIVPISKGNKDLSSSDNYCPIALAPTLSKAHEWCILLSYPDHFLTSGLQFGFKQKMPSLIVFLLKWRQTR